MAIETSHTTVEWVAVDWGTSNVRLWGIGAGGEVVFSRASDQGMGRLNRPQYPEVLSGLLSDTGNSARDVLVCGMAGARQGWQEAAYVDVPADLDTLGTASVIPEMLPEGLSVRILPGVCLRESGNEDVMRGEETQLVGLRALSPGFEGLVVMPGTHSKWATIENGKLTWFASAMTGETFEVLKTHSVLRLSLGGDLDPAERELGFEDGVAHGVDHPERLIGTLFRTRAASLLSGRSPGWCAGYLSGLLIGAEVGGFRSFAGAGEIPLVGGATLGALYARAFARIGLQARIVDATDATLAGLKAAKEHLK